MPITVELAPNQLQGQVTHSDHPALPVGTLVGVRLVDEGSDPSLLPSVTWNGAIHRVTIHSRGPTAGGGTQVIFDLVSEP